MGEDTKPPAPDTATREPTPIPPTATPTDASPSLKLDGFRLVYQTWNNCGPATLTVNLSYFGWTGDQAQAALFLKPDREDKNVGPDEMAAYAHSVLDLQAIARVNGTLDRLKALLRAGIPVIVETGYDPDPETLGWMGHYLLAIGYDDAQGHLILHDVYHGGGDTGDGVTDTYDNFDKFWSHFNRAYVVVYRPDQAGTVADILGADIDDTAMYEAALARAQGEAAADPNNAFAWFNIGTDLVGLGRYEDAAAAYDQARVVGLPWRMLWYQFGPFEAYYHVGRYDDVLALAQANLRVTPYVEETFYYRGLVFQAQGDLSAARENFQLALRYNANFQRASEALAALPQG
jgi:tetratricopeptide (TPR) repeat protein